MDDSVKLEFCKAILEDVSNKLREWAMESVSGGWSTHQVEPMETKAREIESLLYRINK